MYLFETVNFYLNILAINYKLLWYSKVTINEGNMDCLS